MTSAVFLLIALISLYALRQLDPAELVEDLHDLFLVDHDAVGLGQDRVHDRVDAAAPLRAPCLRLQ